MTTPTIYMLIGVPASGKSTWVNNNSIQNAVILSTDNYIQNVADENGLAYNDVFSELIGEATSRMEADRLNAVYMDRPIIWDQTNLTAKSRANKLKLIPNHYRKIAVYFAIPDKEEHIRRLDTRTGKTIPSSIMRNMIASIQIPTVAEGFDEVIFA